MPQIKGKRVLKNGAIGAYVKQKDGSWKWRFIGRTKKKGGGGKKGEELMRTNESYHQPRESIGTNNSSLLNQFEQLLKAKSKSGFANVKYKTLLDEFERIKENMIGHGKTNDEVLSAYLNTEWEGAKSIRQIIEESDKKWSEKKCWKTNIICKKQKKTAKNLKNAMSNFNNQKNKSKGQLGTLNIEMFEFFYGSKYGNKTGNHPRTLKSIRQTTGNNQFYNGNKNNNTRNNKQYSPYPVYSGNVITNANNNNASLNKYSDYYNYYKKAEVTGLRTNTVNKSNIAKLLNNAIKTQCTKYNITQSRNRFRMNEQDLEHGDAFIYRLVLRPNDKVIMFGDFHGSFHTFLRLMLRLEFMGILTNFRLSSGYYIVFCGDILDRGRYALEIITFILRLIEKNPYKVIYNRGNHEVDKEYTNNIGRNAKKFSYELQQKLIGQDIINKLRNFFTTSPSTVILQYPLKKIWCCHGCVPYLTTGQKKQQLSRYIHSKNKCLLYKAAIAGSNNPTLAGFYIGIPRQIRWNDLIKQQDRINQQMLGTVKIGFGYLSNFFEEYGIDFLIRGHQDKDANNVLFMNNNQVGNGIYNEGIDVDKLIMDGYPDNQKLFSKLRSVNNLNVNPVARLTINNDTHLTKQISQLPITDQISRTLDNRPKPIQALTISTNTDKDRYLPKDSFIIVSYS